MEDIIPLLMIDKSPTDTTLDLFMVLGN